ncbi:MAG: hypothetical protein F4237_11410 [Gemmatimonadetes bacterium]|nr:hypothetical protein [Gemmatimonadota bacterium]
MALGEIFQLDDPYVQIEYGTSSVQDISSAVQRARLSVEHVEIDVDAAFGEDVRRTVATSAHSWMIDFEFRTDGYGAASLDKLITAQMHPPLGSGDGSITVLVMPKKNLSASKATGTADAPAYKGKVAVSSWEPLGPGNAGAVVVQSRTFKGFGPLTKLTSSSVKKK